MVDNGVCVNPATTCPWMNAVDDATDVTYRVVVKAGDGRILAGTVGLTCHCILEGYKNPQMYVELAQPYTLPAGASFILQHYNPGCAVPQWTDNVVRPQSGEVDFVWFPETGDANCVSSYGRR
ncbi:hypothetical protein HYH03_002065 [Edaphochlamys debaryana]|uniref:Uncharacterized protein n=1 Tax=Edaphochlamys debaryana TaxID=47281 RepID=A0A836C5A4_9CHLO|nr:hypothetical protein HYH03_002065 [Edaphochlamys debaryana]|eukprot:KAG2499768.1 hypothetical protein HYH03_002065 [Edaphochlamys debaryana]